MDADPVADIFEDVHSAAAHAVAENIAGMTVDNYLAGIHGVADVVLAVILTTMVAPFIKAPRSLPGTPLTVMVTAG